MLVSGVVEKVVEDFGSVFEKDCNAPDRVCTGGGFRWFGGYRGSFLTRSILYPCIIMLAIFGLPLLAGHFWQSRSNEDAALAMLVDSRFDADELRLFQLCEPAGDGAFPGIIEFGQIAVRGPAVPLRFAETGYLTKEKLGVGTDCRVAHRRWNDRVVRGLFHQPTIHFGGCGISAAKGRHM